MEDEKVEKSKDVGMRELVGKSIEEQARRMALEVVGGNHGVKFECYQCGACCWLKGRDFWLTDNDVERILEKHPKYKNKFKRDDKEPWKWKIMGDGVAMCPFLVDFDYRVAIKRKRGKAKCAIQDVKPFVCRIFPYNYALNLMWTEEGIGVIEFVGIVKRNACMGLGKGEGFLRLKKVLWENREGVEFRKKESEKLLNTIGDLMESGKSFEEACEEANVRWSDGEEKG